MQVKIYVVGMFDDDSAAKVQSAVSGVSGVTNVVANASKAQVLVDYADGTAGIDEAISNAIKSTGVDVVG